MSRTKMRLTTFRGRGTEVARELIQKEIKEDLKEWGETKVAPTFDEIVHAWHDRPTFTADARSIKTGNGVSFGLIVGGNKDARWKWKMIDETGRKGGAIIKATKMRFAPLKAGKVQYTPTGKMKQQRIGLNIRRYYPITFPGGRALGKGSSPDWLPSSYSGGLGGQRVLERDPNKRIFKVIQGKIVPRKFTESYLKDQFKKDFVKIVKRSYDRIAKRVSRV